MKKTIFKYGLVLFLTVFAVTITDSAYLLLSPGKSSFSIAEADSTKSQKSKKSTKSKKSQKSDKSEDKDPDHVAKCDQHTGICSNRGTVTVVGMKNQVNVRSGSGSVLLDVTSPNVNLLSNSGDLTGRGLTETGVFKTRIGNIRVKYCKKPQDIGNKTLNVQILESNTKVDDDGDALGSDADLQFPKDSKMKILIEKTTGKYKSDFTHDGSAQFKIAGSVKLGYLFISEYNLPNPPCKY